MPIGAISALITRLLSIRRERVLDKRESSNALADELDQLAHLMEQLLTATKESGHVVPEKVVELERMRVRVWNRWCTILQTGKYTNQSEAVQAEIARSVEIAHAAPGAYIEEIYLVQISLSNSFVPSEVRDRFARSIDRIRDLTVKMRLNA